MDTLRDVPARRRLLLAAAVFLLVLYYVVWPVNFYLAQSLRYGLFLLALPMLLALCFFGFGLGPGMEYRLLVLYWLWLLVSRVLCGDVALQEEIRVVYDLGTLLPCVLVGLVLTAEERRRFLAWFCGLAGSFYALVGLVGLVGFMQRKLYPNPITGAFLGGVWNTGGMRDRISILDTNVTIAGYWYMMALLMMVYAFFACRKKLWRLPILLAGLVDFCVLALTYCRSAMLGTAVALALLAVLLVSRVLRLSRRSSRALVLTLVFLASMPVFLKSFDLVDRTLGRASMARLEAHPEYQTSPQSARLEGGAEMTLLAGRGPARPVSPAAGDRHRDADGLTGKLEHFSSGRTAIWASIPYTLQRDPMRLLRGSLSKDVMRYSNEILWAPQYSYHNYLIQALMFLGLPGFLLLLGFSLLLVRRTVLLFFSPASRADLAVKCLCLPVTASLVYGMFESVIFTDAESRSLLCALFCGLLLGFSRDVCPPKEKR